jgi:hypothetical protein
MCSLVKVVRDLRKLVERRFPLGLRMPVKWPLGVAGVGARQCIERGRDHEFEIALGQHFVSVFEVEHFALLGDAQLAVE